MIAHLEEAEMKHVKKAQIIEGKTQLIESEHAKMKKKEEKLLEKESWCIEDIQHLLDALKIDCNAEFE